MFILGIDGGGTHTRLELRDMENRLLRRGKFGPFNLNSIGEEAFRALLRQIFDFCGTMADCARLCVGGAGISNPAVGNILEEELHAAGFCGKWKLCGDQEIALRGAMDTPGLALIAGTGSICFGKNGAGETARSGGYGHLIDDGGSGYALGRDILSEAVREADGRSEETEILHAVYERLGISEPGGIVTFVYGAHTDKAAIAAFSSTILTLCAQGNHRAVEILKREAEELYAMAQAVQKKLHLEGCSIALLGGLLSEDNCYRRCVVEKLSKLGTAVYPNHDALWGAAQMAWELGGAQGGGAAGQ